MQLSSNYELKLFEGTDNVKRQDFVDNFTKIDSAMKEHDTHLSDMVYQTAGGSATAITLAIKGTLVNGYPITFIASANNGGAVTTINSKKLYKPGTTTSPNLISGKAYTVWYNSTGDCFFIKASAEGTALAPDVRKDKTFSNDNDTGIVGGLDLSLLVSGNIRAGITIDGVTGKSSVVDTADSTVVANHILSGETAYKNGTKVTGAMIDRSGDTACVSSDVSGTTLRLKASEGYRDGVNDNVTITDADFIAANIVSGKNIFGINGSYDPLTMVAGDNTVILSNTAPTIISGGTSSYTAIESVIIKNQGGRIRVSFGLISNASGETAYGRIYVNGVAVGTERRVIGNTPTIFTEDIAVNVNDVVAIYGKVSAQYNGTITLFKISLSNNYGSVS